ncbi:MAG: lysophospholipid acyltransferase family protein, partial [Candidatus Binatia bacterium]
PRGRSWPLPGRPPVSVRFGDPIRRRAGESGAALQRRVRAKLEATLEEDESSWWESLARRDDRASEEAPPARWRRLWEKSRPQASNTERRE